MTEIAKEALELAVRAGNPGEQPEITARRARVFYEFIRAPAGASVQNGATASSYVPIGSGLPTSGAILSDKYPHSMT